MSLSLRYATCATAFLLLFVFCVSFSSAETSSLDWVDREQTRYVAEQQALRQQEQKALQAQQKAEAVRQYAAGINDQQALPIAERALKTATLALTRVRKGLERTTARLSAVDRIAAAQIDGSVAVASTLRGTVEVKIGNGWAKMTPDTLLEPGEEIRTGTDGFAEVMFNDGSRINLHANSTFVLEKADAEVSNYHLSLGRIKAHFKRYGQRRYRVRTPVATAAVRGTEFLLETTAKGASALVVLRGKVEFGPVGLDQKVLVRQGERAILTADGKVRGPEPFNLKILQPWWE